MDPRIENDELSEEERKAISRIVEYILDEQDDCKINIKNGICALVVALKFLKQDIDEIKANQEK